MQRFIITTPLDREQKKRALNRLEFLCALSKRHIKLLNRCKEISTQERPIIDIRALIEFNIEDMKSKCKKLDESANYPQFDLDKDRMPFQFYLEKNTQSKPVPIEEAIKICFPQGLPKSRERELQAQLYQGTIAYESYYLMNYTGQSFANAHVLPTTATLSNRFDHAAPDILICNDGDHAQFTVLYTAVSMKPQHPISLDMIGVTMRVHKNAFIEKGLQDSLVEVTPTHLSQNLSIKFDPSESIAHTLNDLSKKVPKEAVASLYKQFLKQQST
jgi:hypothetical protein